MKPSNIEKKKKNYIVVECGDNSYLQINKLQIEGRNILSIKEFLVGNKILEGEKFHSRV